MDVIDPIAIDVYLNEKNNFLYYSLSIVNILIKNFKYII